VTTLALRSTTPSDAEAVAALLARVALGPTATAQELAGTLAGEDALLLGSDAGVVGFATVRLRGTEVADAELGCEPGHEVLLVEAAEQRARELGATLLRIVPLDAGDDLARSGYREVRTFLRLGRTLAPTALPQELERVAATSRDVYALEQAAFVDAWGFVPETYEQWRTRVTSRFGDGPALLAWRDGEPAGAVRGTTRYGWGWIPTLVVAPAWQGRGVGSVLLTGALAALELGGATRAGLEVDTLNEPAQRLYARQGFEELTRERFFEKAL
jgi:ribosomal protein S18 acetylase RimI-like enzyme